MGGRVGLVLDYLPIGALVGTIVFAAPAHAQQLVLERERLICNEETNQHNFAEKAAACTAWITSSEITPDRRAVAYARRGHAYLQMGNETQARADFNQSNNIKPNADAHIGLGEIFYKRREFGVAELEFTTATNLDPSNWSAFYNRGLAEYYVAKYGNAIFSFREALRLKPDQWEAYEHIALAYYRSGSYPQAVTAFDALGSAKTSYIAIAAYGRGLSKLKQGDPGGNSDLEMAIRLAPDIPDHFARRGIAKPDGREMAEAAFRRGKDKFDSKDYHGAIYALTEAVSADADYADAYLYRGYSYLSLDYTVTDRQWKAIENLSAYLKRKPGNAAAHMWRGEAWSQIGYADRAHNDFTAAIKIKPSSRAYEMRGANWLSKFKYAEALTDLNEAIKLDANNANAYYWRGLTKANINDPDGARADNAKAKQLDPRIGK
jgi:tetratricopeptide (TPR) repeat protein